MKIIGIVGSLRKESFNRKVLMALRAMLPSEVQFEMAQIGSIPLFNEDVESVGTPDSATALCEAIRSADGVIIATPEYNRSIPAPLKNALDWASRPKESVWSGKPVLVLGATPGQLGTATAQYDLKRVLTYSGARVLGQPEIMIGGVHQKMDAQGSITDAHTNEMLQKGATKFLEIIQKGN